MNQQTSPQSDDSDGYFVVQSISEPDLSTIKLAQAQKKEDETSDVVPNNQSSIYQHSTAESDIHKNNLSAISSLPETISKASSKNSLNLELQIIDSSSDASSKPSPSTSRDDLKIKSMPPSPSVLFPHLRTTPNLPPPPPSARVLFQGKAQLVLGASPFDTAATTSDTTSSHHASNITTTSTSTNTLNHLFPASTSTSTMSVPLHNTAAIKPRLSTASMSSADSLFGTALNTNSSSQLFSEEARSHTSINNSNNSLNHPPPTKSISQDNILNSPSNYTISSPAASVFDNIPSVAPVPPAPTLSMAPIGPPSTSFSSSSIPNTMISTSSLSSNIHVPLYNNSTMAGPTFNIPSAPPSMPGIKIPPKPPSVPSTTMSSTAAPTVPVSTKRSSITANTPVPAGMIRTPHGLVPIPTSTPADTTQSQQSSATAPISHRNSINVSKPVLTSSGVPTIAGVHFASPEKAPPSMTTNPSTPVTPPQQISLLDPSRTNGPPPTMTSYQPNIQAHNTFLAPMSSSGGPPVPGGVHQPPPQSTLPVMDQSQNVTMSIVNQGHNNHQSSHHPTVFHPSNGGPPMPFKTAPSTTSMPSISSSDHNPTTTSSSSLNVNQVHHNSAPVLSTNGGPPMPFRIHQAAPTTVMSIDTPDTTNMTTSQVSTTSQSISTTRTTTIPTLLPGMPPMPGGIRQPPPNSSTTTNKYKGNDPYMMGTGMTSGTDNAMSSPVSPRQIGQQQPPPPHSMNIPYTGSNMSYPPSFTGMPTPYGGSTATTTIPSVNSSTYMTNTTPYGNSNKQIGRPACSFISFGFGGKVAVVTPIQQSTINLSPLDSNRPLKYGPVKLYRTLDLLSSTLSSSSSAIGKVFHAYSTASVDLGATASTPSSTETSSSLDSIKKEEIHTLIKLLKSYQGPSYQLASDCTVDKVSTTINLEIQQMKAYLEEISQMRISSHLQRSTYTSSEVCLLNLLSTLVDTEGRVETVANNTICTGTGIKTSLSNMSFGSSNDINNTFPVADVGGYNYGSTEKSIEERIVDCLNKSVSSSVSFYPPTAAPLSGNVNLLQATEATDSDIVKKNDLDGTNNEENDEKTEELQSSNESTTSTTTAVANTLTLLPVTSPPTCSSPSQSLSILKQVEDILYHRNTLHQHHHQPQQQHSAEDAVRLCLSENNWTLGLMIASHCSPIIYQKYLQDYTDKFYEYGSVMHTLVYLYTRQIPSSLLAAIEKLTTVNLTTTTTPKPFMMSPSTSTSTLPANIQSPISPNKKDKNIIYLKNWKSIVCAVLLNKSKNDPIDNHWRVLLQTIGKYLLLQGEIYAAHILYICSGLLPSAVTDEKKVKYFYNLLGCDLIRHPISRDIGSLYDISGFILTECLEYSIALQRIKNTDNLSSTTTNGKNNAGLESDSTSAVTKSISGIFSNITSSLGKNSTKNSRNPSPNKAAGGSHTADSTNVTEIQNSSYASGFGSSNNNSVLPTLNDSQYISFLQSRCRYKLRYAMMLADFGLLAQARSYAHFVKHIATLSSPEPVTPNTTTTTGVRRGSQQKGMPPAVPPTSQPVLSSEQTSIKPLSRKMVAELDEFLERLHFEAKAQSMGGNSITGNTMATNKPLMGVTAAGSTPYISINPYPPASSTSPASGWSLGSMVTQALTSSVLRDFVEGTDNSGAGGGIEGMSTSSPSMAAHSHPSSATKPSPLMSTSAPISSSSMSSTNSYSNNMPPSMGGQPHQPHISNTNNNMTPFPNTSTIAPTVPGPWGTVNNNPSNKYQPPGPNNSNTMNQSHHTDNMNNAATYPTPFMPMNPSTTAGAGGPHFTNHQSLPAVTTTISNNINSAPNTSNQPPIPTSLSTSNLATTSAASSSSKSDINTTNTTNTNNKVSETSAKSTSGKTTPVKASNVPKNNRKSIVDTVKQGLLKMWYPDATDATQNLSEGLDAYYDKDLKRWVFPGEDIHGNNDPAAGPPPMMGPTSTTISSTNVSSVNNSGPPSMAGPVPPSASNDALDPLAALMAPPSRAFSMPMMSPGGGASTDQSAGYDPLAALMAPPPRTSASFSAFPPSSSSMSTGPPTIPSYTNFAMFAKPKDTTQDETTSPRNSMNDSLATASKNDMTNHHMNNQNTSGQQESRSTLPSSYSTTGFINPYSSQDSHDLSSTYPAMISPNNHMYSPMPTGANTADREHSTTDAAPPIKMFSSTSTSINANMSISNSTNAFSPEPLTSNYPPVYPLDSTGTTTNTHEKNPYSDDMMYTNNFPSYNQDTNHQLQSVPEYSSDVPPPMTSTSMDDYSDMNTYKYDTYQSDVVSNTIPTSSSISQQPLPGPNDMSYIPPSSSAPPPLPFMTMKKKATTTTTTTSTINANTDQMSQSAPTYSNLNMLADISTQHMTVTNEVSNNSPSIQKHEVEYMDTASRVLTENYTTSPTENVSEFDERTLPHIIDRQTLPDAVNSTLSRHSSMSTMTMEQSTLGPTSSNNIPSAYSSTQPPVMISTTNQVMRPSSLQATDWIPPTNIPYRAPNMTPTALYPQPELSSVSEDYQLYSTVTAEVHSSHTDNNTSVESSYSTGGFSAEYPVTTTTQQTNFTTLNEPTTSSLLSHTELSEVPLEDVPL